MDMDFTLDRVSKTNAMSSSCHSLHPSLPVVSAAWSAPPWSRCWSRWNCCSRQSKLCVSQKVFTSSAKDKIRKHYADTHKVDVSYENLIGVLADQVDTQFEVAIGAFCPA